ncbi:MAG: hypothetical protein Q7T08_09980 [Devosia sp.]|nr:hypothetical protein [Devosia sp.]
MSILDQLASALGRNDEQPNIALAETLAAKPDAEAVAELVEALSAGTAAQKSDAIKVLYELGERRPEAVADHAAAFIALLGSRNNRLVWGAMHAVASVTPLRAKEVAAALPAILAAADKGSVIAKDHAMSILSRLALAGYASALPILLDRLETAAPNQFPMYCEMALPAVTPAHRARFRAILEGRLAKIEQKAKRARVEKVLRKLANG